MKNEDDDSVLSISNLILNSASMDPNSPNVILKPVKKLTYKDFLPRRNIEYM